LNSDKPVIVFGGTGHYGRNITAALLRKNVPVRVLSRDTVGARKILGDGPEIFEGDIQSEETVLRSLAGVRAVVIAVSAFSPRTIRRAVEIERDAVLRILELAARAGLSRVVYISVYEVNEAANPIPGAGHLNSSQREVENALGRSNLNWTVLGASPSMEIFFSMIRGRTMMVPGGGPPALPTVSPEDLGEIAAQAVLKDDLIGKRFRMTGPEALSFPEASRRISAATGKVIHFRKIPLFLPLTARALMRPFIPLSDKILYLYRILGFVKLLNRFPQEIAREVPRDHRILRDYFDYQPTTLEMEARKRFGSGKE